MARQHAHVHCEVIPPHILAQLVEEGDDETRSAAVKTLAASSAIRARRTLTGQLLRESVVTGAQLAGLVGAQEAGNTVYDAGNGGHGNLPGERKRGRDDPESDDQAVNEAWEGAEATYDFYKEVYDRDSLDGQGRELVSSVHFGVDFDNAFWNSVQMVYGDGSGRLFKKGSMTALDICGHELTHGVTELTAGLEYSKQSGALNESFSDVFGSLVKQHKHGQSAEDADWLIGAGILGPSLPGTALRSMKAPGTANNFDNQPAKMSDYVDLPDDNDPRHDNGGVHINSGIPNHAFYLVATALGGNAWEKAGRIWYDTLLNRLEPTSQFTDAASATLQAAEELFGGGGAEHEAVGNAWREVEVL